VKLPLELAKEQELVVKGIMDFHGVQKEMEFKVTLSFAEEVLQGTSKFSLLCSDFGIEIPKIVADKLANAIEVQVNAKLKKL
jgi:hypothetical protein